VLNRLGSDGRWTMFGDRVPEWGENENQREAAIDTGDRFHPFPAYEAFPVEYYRLLRMPHAKNSDFVMPVLSAGVHVPLQFLLSNGQGVQTRSNDSIIEEIRYLKSDYGVNFIAFSDELLMSSERRWWVYAKIS